jgi:predicted small lipoprotein YifL
MSPRMRKLLLSFAAAAVSLTSGCGDAGPLEPALRPDEAPAYTQVTDIAGLAPADELDIIARFRQTPVITIGWAKKWIGPEGGRLQFLGFALEVPPGAVDKVTMFSIRVPYPKEPGRVVAEFGPHGRKFSRPLIISFPFRGTTIDTESDPLVVWWDTDRWVSMGGWLSANGSMISTYTDHFSEYGTTTDAAYRGGLATTGG